ncbi:MAG: type II 3-dehydroquinate dehydratase [Rhodospirillaceae bacterium TMED8]|nr:type II 3-dehydroquinate dehydratase [Magnetovibrio sp.]OUT51982.1 MAG: type II 3-dehydroquinate dehydratase [Rhodospirillaceae bacterium TMED8]|tara:strand:- start:159 stop:599 length:441 start_codon:yes stop_codon:yes gene_type:complete
MSGKVLILNGPNLNLLGTRDPNVYGTETLENIKHACANHAALVGLETDFRQSNSEGELVNYIHDAAHNHDGIVVNAGAYTHTSVAILDALLAIRLPIIEVHLSNIYRRDEFRHFSYISKAATGVICGLGSQGYLLAIDALSTRLKK